MKLSTTLTLTLMVSAIAAPSQGVLNFANSGNGIDAPVSDWDGNRKLFGPTFAVDLYWAAGVITDSTLLSALGQPAVFNTNGYFFGGIRTIPNTPAGATITCQVRVWDVPDGIAWAQTIQNISPSARIGQSSLFQIMLADNASTAPVLTGLMPFYLVENELDDQRTRPDPVLLTASVDGSNEIVFSWPSYWLGWTFALQQSADLSSTNWVTLTNAPVLIGSQTTVLYQITVAAPQSNLFYRLANR